MNTSSTAAKEAMFCKLHFLMLSAGEKGLTESSNESAEMAYEVALMLNPHLAKHPSRHHFQRRFVVRAMNELLMKKLGVTA